ncbi:uncharacterized protein LOC123294942 [Chrysoperla carnea]|uniref:uncharacterized protein LOC123294942 n=1 Tax=Chrysoperla carnea TaxID=189513 RepID=UPI001D081F1D|nr:uncharacterized protein LOC123294942 [Chrysoperla carnea]
MNSIKLFKIIVEIISIVALANANLVTLDGECPFSGIKPPEIAVVPLLKGKFNIIAETSDGPLNRTDLQMLLKQTSKDSVLLTKRFQFPENEQCYDIKIDIKATEQNGVYDAMYQVAPDTEAVGYMGYFLAFDLPTLFAVGLLCHTLPDSKYQFDIAVLSGATEKYDQAMQERVQKVFKDQNIENLYEYVVEVPQTHKCAFTPQEIFSSLMPSSDALMPSFPNLNRS